MAIRYERRAIGVEENRMGEAGIFFPDERFELLDATPGRSER